MRLLRRLVLAVAVAVAAGAAGCDLRALRSADLYGAAGAPGQGGAGGAAGQGGAGGAAGNGGAGGAAGNAGESGGGGSARGGAAGAGGLGGAGGQPVTDAAVDEGTPDGPPSGCAESCSPDQFCDELTNQCAPRIGTGMLSGVVLDECSHSGLDARIGIAGRRLCSARDKGSYFLSALPLGRLKIAAVKDGYELYSATVEIVAGGVIHDIVLVRSGGCQSPPPVAPCTCTDASCTPMTP
jgi:hypothetical protein